MSEGKREYKGVQGKVVDGIAIFDEQDGFFEIDIRFQDKTGFHIRRDSRMVLEAAELRDWKEGEGALVGKFV